MTLSTSVKVEFIDQREDHKGPCRYQLRCSLPKRWHPEWKNHFLYSHKEATDNKPWMMPFPKSLPGGVTITFSLFLYRSTEYGQDVQYRSSDAHPNATFLFSHQTTKILELTDTNRTPMAKLTLTFNDAAQFPKLNTQPVPELRFPQFIPQSEIDGGWKPSGPVARDFSRTHVPYRNGSNVPVWMTKYHVDYRGGQETVTDRYFKHALHHVTRWFGYRSAEEWALDHKEVARGAEVLAQVIGFYTWQCPYLYDETYDNSTHKFRGTEQFSSLTDKPDVQKWAGDCEDYSQDKLRIHAALRRRNPNDYPIGSPMRRLVEIAHRYCCYVIDASIYNGSKPLDDEMTSEDSPEEVELHMYILMIPWAKLHDMLTKGGDDVFAKEAITQQQIDDTRGWPLLSLESTELSIANWELGTDAIDTFTLLIPDIRHASDDSTKKSWSLSKLHVTHTCYKRDQFYRTVIRGYCLEFYHRYGIHSVLFGNPKEKTYGISHSKLMQFKEGTNDGTVGMKVLGVASDEDAETLDQLIDDMPASHPIDFSGMEGPVEYAPGKEVVRLFVRECDWSPGDDKRLCDSVNRTGMYTMSPCGKQTITIMDGMEVGMYQVLPVPEHKRSPIMLKMLPSATPMLSHPTGSTHSKQSTKRVFTVPHDTKENYIHPHRQKIYLSKDEVFSIEEPFPYVEWRTTGGVSSTTPGEFTAVADGQIMIYKSRTRNRRPIYTFDIEVEEQKIPKTGAPAPSGTSINCVKCRQFHNEYKERLKVRTLSEDHLRLYREHCDLCYQQKLGECNAFRSGLTNKFRFTPQQIDTQWKQCLMQGKPAFDDVQLIDKTITSLQQARLKQSLAITENYARYRS